MLRCSRRTLIDFTMGTFKLSPEVKRIQGVVALCQLSRFSLKMINRSLAFKSVLQETYFLISESQPKHMLWVL